MARGRVSMSIEGMDELMSKLEEAKGRARRAARRAVEDETAAIADDMRDLVPRDTDELHDSIETITDDLSGVVRVGAGHAAHVEFGTSVAPAQPYATPASENSRQRFPDRIADAAGEELT